MADEEKENLCKIEDLEERRADRDLKHWLVKGIAITLEVVFAVSVVTLIYAVVIQEKDLDTGFLGNVFKGTFDFMQFLLN